MFRTMAQSADAMDLHSDPYRKLSMHGLAGVLVFVTRK